MQRQRLLLLAAGIAVVAVIGDKLILTPLMDLWKAHTEEIAQLKQQLEKGEILMKSANNLRNKESEMRGLSLPTDATEAESRLLTALNDWASASRLAVGSLRPRWTEDDLGRRLEVNISANGTIDQIAHFVHAMESDTLPLRVENFELRMRDKAGSDLTLETQISSLILAEGTP